MSHSSLSISPVKFVKDNFMLDRRIATLFVPKKIGTCTSCEEKKTVNLQNMCIDCTSFNSQKYNHIKDGKPGTSGLANNCQVIVTAAGSRFIQWGGSFTPKSFPEANGFDIMTKNDLIRELVLTPPDEPYALLMFSRNRVSLIDAAVNTDPDFIHFSFNPLGAHSSARETWTVNSGLVRELVKTRPHLDKTKWKALIEARRPADRFTPSQKQITKRLELASEYSDVWSKLPNVGSPEASVLLFITV